MTAPLSVLIATPCYAGQLHVALFRSLMGIGSLCADKGIDAGYLVVEGEAAITRGRSNLAATFLREHHDTLAFIDADIFIEPDDFLKLLCLNEPVRGAAISLKTPTHSELLNVHKNGKRLKRAEMPSKPFSVDLIGGAVLLIEREVIERLSEIEELKYHDNVVGDAAHIFAEQIVDGVLLSEDYSFCHRAREHGFSVWCEPSVICTHYGPSFWRH